MTPILRHKESQLPLSRSVEVLMLHLTMLALIPGIFIPLIMKIHVFWLHGPKLPGLELPDRVCFYLLFVQKSQN